MKTLVLGHGKAYKKDEIYGVVLFLLTIGSMNLLIVCLYSKPDILFEIKTGVWTFALDNTYDRIIDTTGGVLSQGGTSISVRSSYPYVLREVLRVLKNNGFFFTDKRNNTLFQKKENVLIKIPKQLVYGTKNLYEIYNYEIYK